MTTINGTPDAAIAVANRVLVIGTLDTIRDRGKEVTKREQRNDKRGRMERLALQVRSPYGGSFLLPLDIDPSVKGGEVLVSAVKGTPLALEGEIQLVKRFDPRFREGVEDEGREVREMHLNVMAIRKPEQNEMYGTSAVWLEGRVVEPPRFMRHPDLPDTQLAITLLDVTQMRPSPIPNSRAMTVERMRVRIAVPVDHPNAEMFYRGGNKVRMEGQLDCIIEAQGGAAVDEQVERLRAEWDAQQELLAEKGEADRRTAERAYRRARQGFLTAPRVQVLAGYAELLDGTTATMSEARELRREYLDQVRNRRRSGQAQRQRASGVGRGPVVRAEAPAETVVIYAEPRVTSPSIAPEAGLSQPVRARSRRGQRAEAAPAPEAAAPVAETPAAEPALVVEAHVEAAPDAPSGPESVVTLPVAEPVDAGELVTNGHHEA